MSCHLLPLRGTSNFHFLPAHSVFGSNGDSRWEGVLSSSFFYSLADSAKHPAGQPLRPLPACPARRSSSPAHLRLPMRPTRVGQTHRKTKTKNILSCSIPFTDEQTFQQVAEEHDAPAFFVCDDFHRSRRNVLRHENLTNLKIYDIIYLQGEGRKMNLHHHLHYA